MMVPECCRGAASIVRRCTDKSTGQSFAVKIVDITTEHQSESDAKRLMAETKDEIAILQLLQGHPSISEPSVSLPYSLNLCS